MGRKYRVLGIAAVLLVGASAVSWGQSPSLSIETLTSMAPAQLDQLFEQSSPGPLPTGQVLGRLLIWPGQTMAGPATQVARVVWQGKKFHPDDATAINRFFGVPMFRAQVKYEPSWVDGAPCHVLDYSQTSVVFRNVRDEIREVSPGLFLGKAYRIEPTPTFWRYFAFEDHRAVR